MIFYVVNPRGSVERVDVLHGQLREMLKNGYRRPTVKERLDHVNKEKRVELMKQPAPDVLDVYFEAPKHRSHDGYGATSKTIIENLRAFGVRANRVYTGQRVAFVYNYPYALENVKAEYKILYTMFESSQMPDDWGRYLRMADKVLVPSEFCQRVMARQFGVEAEVVPLGYDDTIFTPIERIRENDAPFTFLHYDAFKYRKGWDIVLDAYDQEFTDADNVRLIFKTTVDKLPPLDVSAYRNFEVIHKILTPEGLQDLLSLSDCFVFPSRGEGFGVTPLEAMGTGIPAIVPNAHGISQYFDWQTMEPLEVQPIKARYSNDRFKGMDLGAWYQPTVESVRRAMRREYEKWKNSPKAEVNPYCQLAKKFTIEKTAKMLAEIVKNGAKEIGQTKENSIVFISENIPYVSGGRYYSWWCAIALKAIGFDVLLYTNQLPSFIGEFKDYPTPTVYLVDDVRNVDVKAKAYFGSPVRGSERAAELAIKYGKKAYVEVFDPFPIMQKYRGKASYPEWDKLLGLMRNHSNIEITSLCNFNNETIYWWLNKKKSQVHTMYPCINDKEREKSPERMPKKDWVTFVSRLDNHKRLDHVLEAVKRTNCELHVITSIDGINFEQMVREAGMKDRVVIHWKATDKEKFEIIKQSRATINGAIFEGFGMWLPESMSCGVPTVCYDYPIFHEIVDSVDFNLGAMRGVYFAEWGNAESLAEQLQKALSDAPELPMVHDFDFPAMVKRFGNILQAKPKIGVVMCALNEEKFISASLTALVRNENITKVAVVEGCVEKNEHAASFDGLSVDKTHEMVDMVRQTAFGSRKIIFDRYGWAGSKSELRNRALELLGKDMDYILVVDGDEVYKQTHLDMLANFVGKQPQYSVLWFPFLHFWKDGKTVATGGQWEAPLFRFFRYDDKTLHWERHEQPVVNADGIFVNDLGLEYTLGSVNVYHYGYCKDEQDVKSKLEYYRKRDTDLDVKDTFTNWKPGQDTQPTHGGGSTKPFQGKHPVEVAQLL